MLRQQIRFWPLILLVVLAGCATQSATRLLPGVAYYDGPQKLKGKLMFLLRHDSTLETNTDSSASVYEFDLSKKALRKLADSPKGSFIPAFTGGDFCVIYRPGNWFQTEDTNVFVYSKSMRQSRTLTLDSPPRRTAIVGGHVFFEVENANSPGIRDYDIVQDKLRIVGFSDSIRWQYCRYDRVHVPRSQTNVLHFHYNGFGERLQSGKAYRSGYYRLDTLTGEVEWFAESLDDEDDDAHTFKAAGGSFISFEGSGSPSQGFKLVSSPSKIFQPQNRGAKAPEIKVLREFSKLAAIGRGFYRLHTISPDGAFALVSLYQSTATRAMEQSGWKRTYYAIDLSDGKMRLLLKDDVEHETRGSMSELWWVEGEK